MSWVGCFTELETPSLSFGYLVSHDSSHVATERVTTVVGVLNCDWQKNLGLLLHNSSREE